MKTLKYKGVGVTVWEKSFRINHSPVLWLGNDNREEVIFGLIDTIAESVQADIQKQLRDILGVK